MYLSPLKKYKYMYLFYGSVTSNLVLFFGMTSIIAIFFQHSNLNLNARFITCHLRQWC